MMETRSCWYYASIDLLLSHSQEIQAMGVLVLSPREKTVVTVWAQAYQISTSRLQFQPILPGQSLTAVMVHFPSEMGCRLLLFLKAAIVNQRKFAEEIMLLPWVLGPKKGTRLGTGLRQRTSIHPDSSFQERKKRLLGVISKGIDKSERSDKDAGNSFRLWFRQMGPQRADAL